MQRLQVINLESLLIGYQWCWTPSPGTKARHDFATLAARLKSFPDTKPSMNRPLNDHHLKGGGLTLRLKVACLRLKPLEIFPAESRLTEPRII